MSKMITREFVNTVAPEHNRTSCSDKDLNNSSYDIMDNEIQGVIVSRKWEHYPRCTRCFLLNYEGRDLPEGIKLSVRVELELEQPKFEIKYVAL